MWRLKKAKRIAAKYPASGAGVRVSISEAGYGVVNYVNHAIIANAILKNTENLPRRNLPTARDADIYLKARRVPNIATTEAVSVAAVTQKHLWRKNHERGGENNTLNE